MLEGRTVDVVVPVYNNRETLEELTTRCCRAIASIGGAARMIFVEDRSTDDSLRVLSTIKAGLPSTVILENARNLGQQAGIKRGLALVGDLGVVLDADLQDPPEAIPALIEALLSNECDVVFATRKGSYQSAGRMATSRLYRKILQHVAKVPAGAGAFVALRGSVARELSAHPGKGFYLAGLIGCRGYTLGDVPVARAYRGGSTASAYSSRMRLSVALRNLLIIFRERRRHAHY